MSAVNDVENEMSNLHYPAQCECGHIYIEKYEFKEPQSGVAGFCWCGFCRTRLNVMTDNSFKVVPKMTTPNPIPDAEELRDSCQYMIDNYSDLDYMQREVSVARSLLQRLDAESAKETLDADAAWKKYLEDRWRGVATQGRPLPSSEEIFKAAWSAAQRSGAVEGYVLVPKEPNRSE